MRSVACTNCTLCVLYKDDCSFHNTPGGQTSNSSHSERARNSHALLSVGQDRGWWGSCGQISAPLWQGISCSAPPGNRNGWPCQESLSRGKLIVIDFEGDLTFNTLRKGSCWRSKSIALRPEFGASWGPPGHFMKVCTIVCQIQDTTDSKIVLRGTERKKKLPIKLWRSTDYKMQPSITPAK